MTKIVHIPGAQDCFLCNVRVPYTSMWVGCLDQLELMITSTLKLTLRLSLSDIFNTKEHFQFRYKKMNISCLMSASEDPEINKFSVGIQRLWLLAISHLHMNFGSTYAWPNCFKGDVGPIRLQAINHHTYISSSYTLRSCHDLSCMKANRCSLSEL